MSGVYLAYDGSIHGDWISHYAVRLAASTSGRVLHLVRVCESLADGVTEEKACRLRSECQRLGVGLEIRLPRLIGSVYQTLRHEVPTGPGSYLVCGTRRRARQRGLLSGSVSERLLRSNHCHVLAVRVLDPGLLGLPRQLLMPVSGHPRGLLSALPFLRLLAHDVSHVDVLYVERVSRWRYRLLSQDSVEPLRHRGDAYCRRIEDELRTQFGWDSDLVHTQVVVSDDVPKEIVIAANRDRSRLIYLGASERNLTERFFVGNPVEQVLRKATCDVAIYRGLP